MYIWTKLRIAPNTITTMDDLQSMKVCNVNLFLFFFFPKGFGWLNDPGFFFFFVYFRTVKSVDEFRTNVLFDTLSFEKDPKREHIVRENVA